MKKLFTVLLLSAALIDLALPLTVFAQATGSIATVSVVSGGSGYPDGAHVLTVSGGTGGTIDATALGGVITGATVRTAGSGYSAGVKTTTGVTGTATVSITISTAGVTGTTQGPQRCCKIRRAITLDGVTCDEDSRVMPDQLAASECNIPSSGTDCYSMKWGMFCTISTMMAVTDWIFTIMIVAAVLLVIMGAVSLMTAAGDPTKVTEGRNYILYAAIGLLVAFVARAVPSIVKAMLGY